MRILADMNSFELVSLPTNTSSLPAKNKSGPRKVRYGDLCWILCDIFWCVMIGGVSCCNLWHGTRRTLIFRSMEFVGIQNFQIN